MDNSIKNQHRILLPLEEVLEGDLILLIGGQYIRAINTADKWYAKDYIEVKRPLKINEQ